MSKELEILKQIKRVDGNMSREQNQRYAELELLLTPPTAEEVCDAIQEEYKIEKVIYDNRRFYDEEDGKALVSRVMCDGEINIVFHELFSVDTLIKICRFYEALK